MKLEESRAAALVLLLWFPTVYGAQSHPHLKATEAKLKLTEHRVYPEDILTGKILLWVHFYVGDLYLQVKKLAG